MTTIVAQLAAAACDAWFTAAELPTRWATASAEQRATFATCAEFALRQARTGRRDPEDIAAAICAGFWRDAERPRRWIDHGQTQRALFVIVARAVIEAGRASREAAASRAAA